MTHRCSSSIAYFDVVPNRKYLKRLRENDNIQVNWLQNFPGKNIDSALEMCANPNSQID